MRVFLENTHRLFAVYFKYFKYFADVQPLTECIIEEILPGDTPVREGFAPVLVSGMAVCHENDNFYRALGRKIAFTRALHRAFEGEPGRATRAAFWRAYLHEIKIPQHGKTGYLFGKPA
jgi:hypothetical protein